jgi:signal transduction histidine kinase/CheY-like chemotaxis protein
MLITDYLFPHIWNSEFIKTYRKIDLAAVITGLALLYFLWFCRLATPKKKKWLFKLSLIANLIFVSIITGIDFTTLGFSTYIFLLLILTFFFYLDPVTTLVYYFSSFIILMITIYIMGSFGDNTLTLALMLFNIIIVSSLISYRNYKAKIKDIKNQEQATSMNQELELIKENLEHDIASRTKEIITANKELKEYISQIKKINEELSLAKQKAEESDHLKTVFLNNMSHEIRTPLNGIMGFSELIGKPDLKPEKRGYYGNIIRTNSNQLMRVIDDILEISTLEVKQAKIVEEKVDLDEIMDKLYGEFEPLAHDKNIELILPKRANRKIRGFIITDMSKLQKILEKLIDNALKFTLKGKITIDYTMDEDIVQFFVKDTGVGIAGKEKTIIFKRFAQANKDISRRAGGLGIGLSIACENAKLLGGYITMESKQNVGSTFQLIIPNKKPTIDNTPVEESQKAVDVKHPGNDYTVLIAEDIISNFLLIKELFYNEYGTKIKLIHTTNGLEALELCRKKKSIQLVLMDLKMPVMDGFEATKKIKEFRPDLPIVALTAYYSNNDKRKAKETGSNGFLTKPVNKAELINTLQVFLQVKP